MHATADGDNDGEQASPLGPREEQSGKDTVNTKWYFQAYLGYYNNLLIQHYKGYKYLERERSQV